MKIFLVLFLGIMIGTLSGCADTRFKANCDISSTKEDTSTKDNVELARKIEQCYRNPTFGVIKTF